MRVSIILEHRFIQAPDGSIWTQTIFPYSFWERYLSIFDHVQVIARVQPQTEQPPDNWLRADGDRVQFAEIPHYIGPWQYLKTAKRVKQAIKAAIQPEDALILRVPSNLANCIRPWLEQTGRPYALEVVGDPADIFAPGASTHPLRPLFRRQYVHHLEQQCRKAEAISYVTQFALQKRYPPGAALAAANHSAANHSALTHYSSVELPDEAFAAEARQFASRSATDSFQLITVGSLEHLQKAPDILIQSVASAVAQGLNLQLTFIGDGRCRPELEALTQALGMGQRIRFLGLLPRGKAVRQALDQADLFVLPSRQEGLPRAVIEAMARGLPCIASTVGGIAELLPSNYLVEPGNVEALTQIIQAILASSDTLTAQSQRNLKTAKAYSHDKLQARRIAFYQAVQQLTQTASPHQSSPQQNRLSLSQP